MNNKKAKQLRSRIDRMIDQGIIKSNDVDLKKTFRSYVNAERITKLGEKCYSTIVLGDCRRKLYKQVKKVYLQSIR